MKKALPLEQLDHDRVFRVRWLIDYLIERFLNCAEVEVKQSMEEHMVKYKDKSIMQHHIKKNLIKWRFKMWYRCTTKRGYQYEFVIYTGRKEAAKFGLGEYVVLQLTEKLNESFCCIFFDDVLRPHCC